MTQDFERFSPRITGFFAYDKAIGWLLFLAYASQTDRQHVRRLMDMDREVHGAAYQVGIP